ncbi:MAG TPA: DUF885 domain-containing protein [Bryobacteraceae bacterium]|nr:DUF885 domain-containing protein [Bryobacteraceae bacterium]
MRVLILMLTAAGALTAQSLTDRFFDEYYFPFNPSNATSVGIHRYDDKLEDDSKAGVAARVAILRKFEAEFAAQPESADGDLVLNYIRANLLELETIRSWEKNPDNYSSGIAASAFAIMSRTFAPPEARLRSLIARERLMPQALADARDNLNNPPKIYTEIAIEQLPGIARFFERDVPLAFAQVSDSKLLGEFQQTNQAVVAGLKSYETFLRTTVLKKSHGDFRLGAANFAKKLEYEEMVDIPLDRLLQIGYDDLHKNQRALMETAQKIDPKKTPRQVLAGLEKDHPAPDQLLQAFRDECIQLRDFISAKKIITIPSPVLPILEETPPFMRALTFASLDPPGPYETVAKEAYFNVTLPEKGWKPARVEDFMRAFNRGTVLSTAIHEAYPGHYVQFLWQQINQESRARKLLAANSNVEGWAHYCEQMMLDEGVSTDPKMRLGQLQDALLRDARYIAGIEMHTGKMTIEQGVAFFETEGFQTHETAERETKRGTSDPTYLYYTLGKLQIMKLREDYQKMKGAGFSLEQFHDAFMAQGYPPIKIVRRALLGNDSPTL